MKNDSRNVADAGLAWPSRVPRGARFAETFRNEGCVSGEFFFESGKIQVTWSLEGPVLWECPYDRHGARHGAEISRHENGAVEWRVPWVRGSMQGAAQQFDEAGHVLYRSRFNRGTGVDLWVQGDEIVEFREVAGNERHGLERWGHPRLPYEESFFLRGKRAGVFRRWSGAKMDDGYPKFYVDDQEVTKRYYSLARRRNTKLPAYVPAEDSRSRPMHRAFRSIWLRKGIRAALMKVPGVDEMIGCGAHRRP